MVIMVAMAIFPVIFTINFRQLNLLNLSTNYIYIYMAYVQYRHL
jgi:hypothetical protein